MGITHTISRLLDTNLVQFVPGLKLSNLFCRPRAAWDDVLPSGAAPVLTYSGSAALFRAGQVIGLATGDTVLVPDYNCGHEFEPLLRLGADVQSYAVDAALRPDLYSLSKQVAAGPKAILATHYFGFPQDLAPLRQLCDRHGVLLIEDCAHVLNPQPPVGLTGDVSVFSFRKTLPLPDGGALVVNNPKLAKPDDSVAPPWQSIFSKLLDLAGKACLRPARRLDFVAARGGLVLLAPLLAMRALLYRAGVGNDTDWFDPDDEDLDFSSRVLTWRMSGSARRILLRTDIAACVEKRRRNFAVLIGLVQDMEKVRPLFDTLPAGACPMVLPVTVSAPDHIYGALSTRGVSTAVWWESFHPALQWAESSVGVRLKRTVLALPIHQGLESPQLQRLARALREATTA